MTDPDKKSILQAAGELSQTKPGTSLSTWKTIVRVIAIGIPILGAIPTAYNLYYAIGNNSPLPSAAHDRAQAQLWLKNRRCPLNFQKLHTAKGTRVDVAGCPTGDLLVKVSYENGQLANQEWIAFDDISAKKEGFSIFSSLIGPAYAADVANGSRPQSKPHQRVAEQGMTTVCQEIDKKGQVVRIVKENNKCFKEQFSIYKGIIDGREEVPCETTCSGGTQS